MTLMDGRVELVPSTESWLPNDTDLQELYQDMRAARAVDAERALYLATWPAPPEVMTYAERAQTLGLTESQADFLTTLLDQARQEYLEREQERDFEQLMRMRYTNPMRYVSAYDPYEMDYPGSPCYCSPSRGMMFHPAGREEALNSALAELQVTYTRWLTPEVEVSKELVCTEVIPTPASVKPLGGVAKVFMAGTLALLGVWGLALVGDAVSLLMS